MNQTARSDTPIDPWAIPPEQEARFTDHVRREGRNAWNDNPDGCYFCGSPHHHSDSCQEAA